MKKLMTSMIIVLPLLILAIMLVSGAIMSLVTHIYVESVEFVENSALVLVMKDEAAPPSEKLEVNILPLKAENRDLIFTVEDESIASYDEEKGTVTARGFGETYITVMSAENKAAMASRKIVVTDDRVHALRMGEYEHDLYVGDGTEEPLYLTVEVLPQGAINKGVTWTSSNPSVLSVQGGAVKCLGKGTVTVTAASAEDPSVTATAEFECHVPLSEIDGDRTDVVTAERAARFPHIVPSPADATYEVSYSSSDEALASADGEGNITFYGMGSVLITATAKDGRGHTDSFSVRYHCTDGYFRGPLFPQKEYTFDYDDGFGKAEGLPILFSKDPVGSTLEIVSVSFDREGILAYDADTEKFSLLDVKEGKLGTVKVTVHAKKYDVKSGTCVEVDTDTCTVTVTRKTQKITFLRPDEGTVGVMSVNTPGLSLTEELVGGRPESGIGVLATPVNHTDTLAYSLGGSYAYASLQGKVLTFTGEGTAVVVVTAESGAEARLTVTYTKPGASDKTITADGTDVYEVLAYWDAEDFESGILKITAPDGYTAECVSGAEEVLRVEGFKLIPQKGGFAEVTVTFRPTGDTGEETSFTVYIYVDRAVNVGDLSIDKEGFTTSLEELDYSVTLSVPADAMAGKVLFLGGENKGEALSATAHGMFGSEKDLTLSASVRYAESLAPYGKTGEVCRKDATAHTTHGNLTSLPEITCGEEAFENTLAFGNIGEEIVLTVSVPSPSPADFVLTEEKIAFDGAEGYFTASVSVTENVATLTLTSEEGTYGKKNITLNIAGQEIAIELNVLVPADTIAVSYGSLALEEEGSYDTILPAPEFTLSLSRKDGRQLSDECKKAEYECGAGKLNAAPAGKRFAFTVETSGEQRVTVTSGTASFAFTLKKHTLAEFGYSFTIDYSDNGRQISVGPFPCGEERVEVTFPQAIQGSFKVCISADEDLSSYLGGLDEAEAQTYFTLEKAGWEQAFSVSGKTAVFSVTLPAAGPFTGEEMTLSCGEQHVLVVLGKADIRRIEFEGYDMGDKSNGGDVYKGYQQVRVFAKQSDYGDGKGTVDYFSIPYKAEQNDATHTLVSADAVVWQLVRHSDKDGTDTLLTRQHGTKVEYGEEVYTVVPVAGGPSTLKNEEEEIIAQGGKYEKGKPQIPWVDVYAQEGMAQIYFGNFGGLAETDVQNDYFGNFGEQAEWKRTEQTIFDAAKEGSGRTFTPSENAYAYLRVEASDGAKDSSASAHFNFNVLDDAALVNVFNAAGYLNNKKIVLHKDLYGADEVAKVSEPGDKYNADQFLDAVTPGSFTSDNWNTQKAPYQKDLIYGNGNSVNLKTVNDGINTQSTYKSGGMLQNGQENTGYGFAMGTLYNVTVKGTNEDTEITPIKNRILFNLGAAYYSTIQSYSKLNPSGTNLYLKNTVLRYVANCAIQLYKATGSLYFENVVIDECLRAVSLEAASTAQFYFKGFTDVLNYRSAQGMQDAFKLINGGASYARYFVERTGYPDFMPGLTECAAKEYLEWFGSDGTQGKENYRYYANMLVTNGYMAASQMSKKQCHYWDDGTSQYSDQQISEVGIDFVNAFIGMDDMGLKMGVEFSTYATKNTVDGGATTFDSRDTKLLFTNERYIRLLCEYVDIQEDGTLVKNTDHIMWHMQKVYRDVSLITGRTTDHITALKESLDNALKHGWDGVWPDGTTLQEALDVAAIAARLSEAVLPSKETY